MAQDHNDIYSIVERLAVLEGRITPTNVKHGLNAQQKSVPQMPALFKPKTQKILGGNSDAKNPMSGYAVGGCEENEELEEDTVAEDVLDKVKKSFADYLSNIADEIKQDSDLKDKKKEDTDLKKKEKTDRDLSPKQVQEHGTNLPECEPVKIMTLEDGSVCEVHGEDGLGFEIRHGNRKMNSRFKNLEEAEIALEMFNARLRARHQSDDEDYLEEK